MGTTEKTNTVKSAKKKRPYNKNVKSKIKKGGTWNYGVEFDNDVALAIIKEKEGLQFGGEYNAIINERMRQAYGLKSKK